MRLTSRTRSQAAASSRCTGPPPATPAAFTTASRRPCSRTTCATSLGDRGFVATSSVATFAAVLHVGADDTRAFGRGTLHAGGADPRRRAGHQRDLACQPTHARTSDGRGRLPRRTHERKPTDEIRALLRDPGGASLGRGQRTSRLQEHARAGGVRRARAAGTRSGPSSTISSRSTRTARIRRCSTARSPRGPRACASATACG